MTFIGLELRGYGLRDNDGIPNYDIGNAHPSIYTQTCLPFIPETPKYIVSSWTV